MKETTINTIGWTVFGITFVIMFISMAISNAQIETTININMDNETKEALIKLSENQHDGFCIVKEYETIVDSNSGSILLNRALIDEYQSNNCTYVGKPATIMRRLRDD